MKGSQASDRTARHLADTRSDIDEFLSTVIPDGRPPSLFEASRYVLDAGGKRVRPTVVLLTAEAFGVARGTVMPVAAACEVFHNFTLVHDDIMDRSDTRRGRPTVHNKWDESTAILAGDYLFGRAYALLDQCPVESGAALRTGFSRMVTRLCEGQALDMALASPGDASVDDYLDMIDGKTGALLAFCLEAGGIVGGADRSFIDALHDAGLNLGRAFQIQDDLLDAVAETDAWGKTRGQDLQEGKRTFLVMDLLANGPAKDRKYFEDALATGGFRPDQVDEATRRLKQAGVLDRASLRVDEYTSRSSETIDRLPDSESRDALRVLVDLLSRRGH